MKTKLLKLFLVVAIMTMFTPVITHALTGGTCGSGVIWMLDDAGVLTISGNGAMKFDTRFDGESTYVYIPWDEYSKNIKKIIVEDGITSIAEDAFHYCKNLTEVILPDSVTNIDRYAFYDCENLKEIKLPSGITRIAWGTFISTGLVTVEIPEGVTSIEKYAFMACKNLKSITIPTSVQEIGKCMLGGTLSSGTFDATRFKDMHIYYNGSRTQWNNIAIDNAAESGINGADFENGNARVFANVNFHFGTKSAVPAPTYSTDSNSTTFNVSLNIDELSTATGNVKIEILGADNEQKSTGTQGFSNAAYGDTISITVPYALQLGDIVRTYTILK